MEKRKGLYLKLALYATMLVVSVGLALHFFSQARTIHRTFDQFAASQTIEADMPIGFVMKKFGISEQDIFTELRLPVNRWNKRYTIIQACQKNKLDCQAVIDALNEKISR